LCSEFSIHYDKQYIQNTWKNIRDIEFCKRKEISFLRKGKQYTRVCVIDINFEVVCNPAVIKFYLLPNEGYFT